MATTIVPANTAKTHNARKFMDEIRGWFGDFEVKLTEAHRESAKIFFHSVVIRTPKKTGYASYNWRYSQTGSKNPSLEQRIEQEGYYFGRTVDEPDFSGIRWNSNSVIYNFVPYIPVLNGDIPPPQPNYSVNYPHFFQHSVAEAENYLQGLLRNI